MIERKVKIINKLGLHARAASKLVSLASSFASEIELAKDFQTANGKSIMGVMMLAASQGTELSLVVTGEDEEQAINQLEELIQTRFGEDE